MTLVEQLGILKTSVVDVFNVNDGKRETLLYDDASSIGRRDAYKLCKKGFKKLCKMDKRFLKFEHLYMESSIDLVPELLDEQKFLQIKQDSSNMLRMLIPVLDEECAIGASEWLMYKYQIHKHEPEELLLAAIPFHNYPIFLKYIRLIDKKNKNFSWLESIYEAGIPPNLDTIVGICLRRTQLIEMMYGWPIKIEAQAPKDNTDAVTKQLCHFLLCLGVKLIDRVRLSGVQIIERTLNPVVRMIDAGLSSRYGHWNAACLRLVMFISERIPMNDEFVSSVFSKVLSGQADLSIEPYSRCRFIMHVWGWHLKYQKRKGMSKLELSDEHVSMFKSMVDKINDAKDKNHLFCEIERVRFGIKLEKNEAMEIDNDQSSMKMEVEIVDCAKKGKKINEQKMEPDKKLIKSILSTISIDWEQIEEILNGVLIGLLREHVLTWHNKDTANRMRISTKVALNVVNLMHTSRPKGSRLPYKQGGLTSYLCMALFHPNNEIREVVVKLVKQHSHGWNHRNRFLEAIKRASDGFVLCSGAMATVLMEEIDRVLMVEEGQKSQCSVTLATTALLAIREQTVSLLPRQFSHVWSALLNWIENEDGSGAVRDCFQAHIAPWLQKLDTEHQQEILSKIVDLFQGKGDHKNGIDGHSSLLLTIPLSVQNILWLLRDALVVPVATPVQSSLRRLSSSQSLTTLNTAYSTESLRLIDAVMFAFCSSSHLSPEDQLSLIEPIATILRRIVARLSMLSSTAAMETGTEQAAKINREKEASLGPVTSIMKAFHAILATVATVPTAELDSVSSKVSLEDVSKCLYLFRNRCLVEMTLSVIQSCVRLGLGSGSFNLIFFISWIGSYLVPLEDDKSLATLDGLIRETLPLQIRQKRRELGGRAEIVAKFIEECSTLPKHRVVLLFKSIVTSLSTVTPTTGSSIHGDSNEVLWMQLVLMSAIKTTGDGTQINNNGLWPALLREFPIDEQLQAVCKALLFLTTNFHGNNNQTVGGTRKKRKLGADATSNIDYRSADSPAKKKRKTNCPVQPIQGEPSSSNVESISAANDDEEFESVRTILVSISKRNGDLNNMDLLATVIKNIDMHLKESSNQLASANNAAVKSLVSGVFVAMRTVSISQSIDQAQTKNELCRSLRQIIDCVSVSLSTSTYVTMVTELISSDDSNEDGNGSGIVRSKCLELLAKKLSITKGLVMRDIEIVSAFLRLVPVLDEVIRNRVQSPDWVHCVMIAVSLVSMDFPASNDGIAEFCDSLFQHLLAIDFSSMPVTKSIVVNLYFKSFVSMNRCHDLSSVLEHSLRSLARASELESGLLLVLSVLQRPNAESVGWALLGRVARRVIELSVVDASSQKPLTMESIKCLKEIRIKLSKMSNTKSIVDYCIDLIDSGINQASVAFVTGAINLFGCHLAHLNKSKIDLEDDDEGSTEKSMWQFIYRSLSVPELMHLPSATSDSQATSIEEISIKSMNQLCILLDFSDEILQNILVWCQQKSPSPMATETKQDSVTNLLETYIDRVSIFYRIVAHLVSNRSNPVAEVLEFVSRSYVFPLARILLKHLSIDLDQFKRAKRRKNPVASVTIATENLQSSPIFSFVPIDAAQMTTLHPDRCANLIQSIAFALLEHLRAEHQSDMNLPVTDESIDLISSVCQCLLSIDRFLTPAQCSLISEHALEPLVVQLAVNCFNDEALLHPLVLQLTKQFAVLNTPAIASVLRTLAGLKQHLGDTFDSSIKDLIGPFVEECQLCDDESIVELADAI